MTDALRWGRENVERWIEQGDADARKAIQNAQETFPL
jgi:hypothetical protein